MDKGSDANLLLLFQYTAILKSSGCVAQVIPPSHVFEVVYSEDKQFDWDERKGGLDILTTFHGTACQNIHSILHNGLISHLNKV